MVLILAAAICWMLAGCTSVKHTFEDVPADQAWTAMVAVAEHPRYDDWRLAENEVWVDQAGRRIEIYRRVHRVLYRPEAKPYPQERAYRFQVRLDPQETPEAVFTSRGFNVPAWAWAEGDRYFADVLDLLAGPGAALPETATPEPAPEKAAPDIEPEPAAEPEPAREHEPDAVAEPVAEPEATKEPEPAAGSAPAAEPEPEPGPAEAAPPQPADVPDDLLDVLEPPAPPAPAPAPRRLLPADPRT